MNTVLFDLDGTLLPINQDDFLNGYMREIAKKFAQEGVAPQKFVKAIGKGTAAMLENDGTVTNEKRFWEVFTLEIGPEILALEPKFEEFYLNEFNNIAHAARPNPLTAEYIRILKEKGYRLVAATNPLFPRVATLQRIQWAQLDPADFFLITTYENSSFCKPNLNYYREILAKVERDGTDCLMVGNDVDEDMCAAELGMETFLLTDHMLDSGKRDWRSIRNGTYEGLLDYIAALPAAN